MASMAASVSTHVGQSLVLSMVPLHFGHRIVGKYRQALHGAHVMVLALALFLLDTL